MIIVILPSFIPRFNWARELRGFRNFLAYYGARAQRFQEQMDHVGQREKETPRV